MRLLIQEPERPSGYESPSLTGFPDCVPWNTDPKRSGKTAKVCLRWADCGPVSREIPSADRSGPGDPAPSAVFVGLWHCSFRALCEEQPNCHGSWLPEHVTQLCPVQKQSHSQYSCVLYKGKMAGQPQPTFSLSSLAIYGAGLPWVSSGPSNQSVVLIRALGQGLTMHLGPVGIQILAPKLCSSSSHQLPSRDTGAMQHP